MSTLLFIIGFALTYFGINGRGNNRPSVTVKETISDLANKEVGSAIGTVARHGFKIYARIMMVGFGIVFMLIALMGWLLF